MSTIGSNARCLAGTSSLRLRAAHALIVMVTVVPGCGSEPSRETSQPNVAREPSDDALADAGIVPSNGKDDVAEARRSVDRAPNSAAAHSNLGLALVKHNKYDEAIAEYRAAIQIAPDLADVHHNLAMAFQLKGDYAQAIAALREAVRLSPDDAESYYRLGGACVANGQPEDAIAAYRQALSIDPKRNLVPGALARLLVFAPNRPRSDYEEALALVREAAARPEDNEYDIQTLALAEYRIGRWDAGMTKTEQLAKADEGDAADWFLLALAHGRKGEQEQARAWHDKAVSWLKQGHSAQPLMRQLGGESSELLGLPVPEQLAPGGSEKSGR